MKDSFRILSAACALAAVLFMAGRQALADTHTWTGAGDGTTLSQGTNWEGNEAPVAGDRISIPSGMTVTVGASDAAFLESLAGADVNGELEVKEVTAGCTLPATFTLAGSGKFTVRNGGKAKSFNIYGDNSVFTGPFHFTNSLVHVYNNRALGISNPVSVHAAGLNVPVLIIRANGIYANPMLLDGGSGYFVYESYAAVTNTALFTCTAGSNSFYSRITSNDKQGGHVTMLGGVASVKGNMDFNGDVLLAGDAEYTAVNHFYCDTGTLRIKTQLSPSTMPYLRIKTGMKFVAENVLNGVKVQFSGDVGPILDLNGYSQTMGNLEDVATLGRSCIHSATPATLTMTGSATGNRYGGYFSGAVSFTLDSSGKTVTLTNNAAYPSTTTGSLTAKAGTIALGGKAVFTALDSLVLDGGTFSVAAGATVNASARLRVTSNGGTLSLDANAELAVATARVNGGFAPADVYTAANPGPFAGILSGSGTLRVVSDMEPIDDSPVYTWIGGTDTSLATAANWQGGEAPTFGGTETIVFKENNGTANVSGAIKAYALKFDGTGTFVLTGGEGARIDVMYGGVTVTNSASSASFDVTVAPSIRVMTSQDWTVPLGDKLTLSSELQAAPTLTTANVVTGVGQGELHLLADNSAFLPRFDFKYLFAVCTTNGKGLGSPSRAVSCYAKIPCFYGGKPLTNDVPLVLTGIAYQDERDKINMSDTPLVQRGHITLANTSAGTRYIAFHASGSIEGGVSSPNAANSLWLRAMSSGVCVKIEKEPISGLSTLLPDQIGWYEISCTNNSFDAMRVNKTFVRCMAENVIPPSAALRFGQPNYGPSNRSPWGWFHGALDLCGHDQTVSCIEMSGKVQGEHEGQGVVTSGVPASVFVTGVHTNTALPMRFIGAAGCTLDAVGALMAFSNGVSTTSGELCVSNGELRLDAGFAWVGSNMVTVAGGRLTVTAGAADGAFGGDATLTKMQLSGSGILDLPSGKTVTVNKLCVDGKEAPSGMYGGADGSADKRYAAHFGPGTGVLRVRRSDISGTMLIIR